MSTKISYASCESAFSPSEQVIDRFQSGLNYFNMEHYKNLSLENLQGEVWKPIPNYEGLYMASSFGRIKSLNKIGNIIYIKKTKTTRAYSSKILSQNITRRYLTTNILKSGKYKTWRVARLVAFAFIENPFKKPLVNHLDGNKLNNHYKNLEWATYSENLLHAYSVLGRKSHYKGKIGGLSSTAKKVVEMDLNGKKIKIWDSMSDANVFYNKKRTDTCISICCKGKTKTAFNRKWQLFNEQLETKQSTRQSNPH